MSKPDPPKKTSWTKIIVVIGLFYLVVYLANRTPTHQNEPDQQAVRAKRPGDYALEALKARPAECDYLASEGLSTGAWTLHSDGGMCMSSTLEAGGTNAVAFSARGTQTSVTHMQLFDVISDVKQMQHAYKTLGNCAGTLLGKLSAARAKNLGTAAPTYKDLVPLARALDRGDVIEGVFYGMPVAVTHGKLPAGKRGWTVTLDVTVPD